MKRYTVYILFINCFLVSCKKFVQVDPPVNELPGAAVYTSDETAVSAMRGLYIQMSHGGIGSITHLAGLSSDELINYTTTQDVIDFNLNGLLPTNTYVSGNIWGPCYNMIFHANSILEGIKGSTGMTEAMKKQLEGEAKFMRAFFHFYLFNLFGDIPVITSTDHELNRIAQRATGSVVYQQIINDLQDAQNLMVSDYSTEGGQRIRPNKWVATALLARVYLYKQEWMKAEEQATSLVNNAAVYKLPITLDSVFLKNNTEAIWQLMPTGTGANTNDGNLFIISAVNPQVAMTNVLYNAFEPADNRKTKWTSSYTSGATTWPFAWKYKIKSGGTPLNEYTMVLRLAEQYLIRAEARAKQDKIAGAQADINIIRNRAGLANTSANDQTSLLVAIEQERRVELFTEWGHRWFDLKRTNRAGVVLGPVKGANWHQTDVLYPIPQVELNNDPNLTQNAGY